MKENYRDEDMLESQPDEEFIIYNLNSPYPGSPVSNSDSTDTTVNNNNNHTTTITTTTTSTSPPPRLHSFFINANKKYPPIPLEDKLEVLWCNSNQTVLLSCNKNHTIDEFLSYQTNVQKLQKYLTINFEYKSEWKFTNDKGVALDTSLQLEWPSCILITNGKKKARKSTKSKKDLLIDELRKTIRNLAKENTYLKSSNSSISSNSPLSTSTGFNSSSAHLCTSSPSSSSSSSYSSSSLDFSSLSVVPYQETTNPTNYNTNLLIDYHSRKSNKKQKILEDDLISRVQTLTWKGDKGKLQKLRECLDRLERD